MITWQGYITLASLFVLFCVLAVDKFNDSFVIFANLLFLWNLGIINSSNALNGFSNSGMLTVGALFVVVSTMQKSGVISQFMHKVFGNSENPKIGLARSISIVTILSAFFNNTPLVAIMMPIVRDWARKMNFPRSKFLIPLSYAAISGGMLTNIGTSTNLLVVGILQQNKLPPLGFFEIGYLGLPLSIISLLFISTIGFKILPNNGIGLLGQATSNIDEYVTEIYIRHSFKWVGQSIFVVLQKLGISQTSLLEVWREIESIDEETNINEEAGLRKSLLSQDMRAGIYLKKLQGINEANVLRAGDRLVLSCRIENLQDLRKKGIKGITIGDISLNQMQTAGSELVEVVVSHRCPMIGEHINSLEFKREYQCSVVGARRKGTELPKVLDNVCLNIGDTLLLMTSKDFYDKFKHSNDFYAVCKIGNIQSKLTWWDYGPLLIFALMMALATSSVMQMEQAAFLAAGLNVMGGWISTKKSLEVIDWSLLLMIGSSIGISNAMEKSGLARWLGEKLAGMEASAWNINFLLYLVCLLMTEIVTNNAAAALCMPIALNVAKALELSYRPFTVSIMMASSCGFAIPFGYATHLMVMSPGGYKFIDFIKIGVPLDIIYWIGTCLLGPLIFPF